MSYLDVIGGAVKRAGAQDRTVEKNAMYQRWLAQHDQRTDRIMSGTPRVPIPNVVFHRRRPRA